jgi:SRSO17 transposase
MERRAAANVPEDVVFRTKWQIALALIDAQRQDGMPGLPVLADAGYGDASDFRDGLTERQLLYAVGINKTTTVWANGNAPLPPKVQAGKGQPGKRLRRDAEHQPVTVKALAESLPKSAWNKVPWAEGSGMSRSMP